MAAHELDRFERAVEESRAEMTRTLAALETRLSAGRLAEEAVSAVRVREEAGRRHVSVDGWSLAMVALAGAWLLWSHSRRQDRPVSTLPAEAGPEARGALPPPSALRDAAE